MRCAILDDYQNAAFSFADWTPLEDRLELVRFDKPFPSEEDAAEALCEFEIIVAMRERTPFPNSLLRRLPALKLLVTTGMRNAAIDLAAARDCGVTVCGTEGSPHGTPEMTFALILGAARRVAQENAALRRGGWQTTIGTGLHGKTLGIIGLGNVGQKVAQIGAAFGMELIGWSANLSEERASEVGVKRAASLGDLLERADVATVHLKLGERSRGLIGAGEIARMKPSSILVNTARGPIVDEPAIIASLQQNRIACYAADVFDTEPLPLDHPFRSLPNVLATPHLGYVTDDCYRLFYGGAMEDVLAYLDGTPRRILS